MDIPAELLAAAVFAGTSVTQNYVGVLLALTLAVIGLQAANAPPYTLPRAFLTGTALAGAMGRMARSTILAGLRDH